ncbi:GNAT family N-acetyltransferase [Ornithinicoccus hortensis]|uniref:Acetyltransferase (GNAT) family protein n=1 Tax=Ornithinicoccus hortensis TaxID=82346 RepID=A0A542YPZ5_9MICO|nr:GNAT family N-acetyltransferase [Ornithinicoccus hortensis]TQL50131.1 acetyltransferase (GNAT) family protein [Ornithinicoccus hortensis]
MRARLAEPGDLELLLPMLLDMGFVDDEAALRDRFPLFCASVDHPILVAVDEGGALLGYAALHDLGQHLRSGNTHRTVKLDDLYTAPAHRRRGVARLLMEAVESWARSQPVRYVFWYANQGPAGAAYQAMGYEPDGSGQEGFDFYEIDLGDPHDRLAHPQRGT